MSGCKTWMVLSVLVCLAVSLAGCGDEAELVVHLETPGGDDPYQEVAWLRLILQQDSADDVSYDDVFPADSLRMELPAVTAGKQVRVTVLGYRDRGLQELVARGMSDWIRIEKGRTLHVDLCFCSLEVIESGGCVCDGR